MAVSLKEHDSMLIERGFVAVVVHHASVCVVYVFAGHLSMLVCRSLLVGVCVK